jgi:glycosyltransferase involved in cell wall biosynthesis
VVLITHFLDFSLFLVNTGCNLDSMAGMQSKKVKILMVTGVFYPELNGAVLQCMQLIKNLSGSIEVSVLSGASNKAYSKDLVTVDFSVTSVFMPKLKKIEFMFGALHFFISLLGLLRKNDLVHIHGFSKRNAIVIWFCRIFNKKVILKMTSYGHDDPLTVKKSSFIFWQLFKCCHAYIGISPAFFLSYQAAGLSEEKWNFIPNCVDLNKFSPITTAKKKKLKYKYAFSDSDSIVLFVGHFSIEKRPLLAYKIWLELKHVNPNVKLIFIGATKNLFEVDDSIVDSIKIDAINKGVLSSIHFVENTFHVDDYMKIADVFLLPSTREGLPNVLLEAMACSLPCFVTNILGVTDWIVEDNRSGFLLNSDNPADWANKIKPYVQDLGSPKIGFEARRIVENKFSCAMTALAMNNLYKKIV